MDKLPQVPAQRVTHVVSLAGVSIIVMPALAFASAPCLPLGGSTFWWLGSWPSSSPLLSDTHSWA